MDYKDKLLKIVQLGELELGNKMIRLNYLSENQVSVLFDRKNLDLKGWEIIDQYNNNINFTLNVVGKNDVYKKDTFKIPEIN